MPYTLKSLQKEFNLSADAVISTLEKCGIEPSKPKFTDEEIETLFAKARFGLDSGAIADYSDIPEYLASNAQEQDLDEEMYGALVDNALVDNVSSAIAANLKSDIARESIGKLADMFYNGELAAAIKNEFQLRGFLKPFNREEFLARREAKRKLAISPTHKTSDIEAEVVEIPEDQPS